MGFQLDPVRADGKPTFDISSHAAFADKLYAFANSEAQGEQLMREVSFCFLDHQLNWKAVVCVILRLLLFLSKVEKMKHYP